MPKRVKIWKNLFNRLYSSITFSMFMGFFAELKATVPENYQ